MTDDDLRRLAEAATPGEWRLEYDEQYRLAYRHLIGPAMSLSWPTYATDLSREQTGQREVDGAYIAAANPETMKRLLDRVAKAEADALAAHAALAALGIPLATLAGLRDGTLVAVPVEATEAMFMAAGDVPASNRPKYGLRIRIGDMAAAEAWRRMLAARPNATEPTP